MRGPEDGARVATVRRASVCPASPGARWAGPLPNFYVAPLRITLWLTGLPALVTSHPAIAVIDGKLCRLSRNGAIAAAHAPLATAVLEFRHGPMQLYVREHPYGLLPGVPNLYCLDGAFRLRWLAEWPLADDPCGRIVEDRGDTLVAESTRGVTVQLDAETGRVRPFGVALAAAS